MLGAQSCWHAWMEVLTGRNCRLMPKHKFVQSKQVPAHASGLRVSGGSSPPFVPDVFILVLFYLGVCNSCKLDASRGIWLRWVHEASIYTKLWWFWANSLLSEWEPGSGLLRFFLWRKVAGGNLTTPLFLFLDFDNQLFILRYRRGLTLVPFAFANFAVQAVVRVCMSFRGPS